MKVSKWIVLALSTVLALALVGCGSGSDTEPATGGSAAPEVEELVGQVNIEGSDTMVNLASAWSEEFQNEFPGVLVSVKGGGSGVGIASLINGTVDFANASREMKDEEKDQITGAGRAVAEHEVARDGIAIVVNPANAVVGLTEDQLHKIYLGEITNWKEVGGADKKIVVLSRDTASGTYEFFKEAIVGKEAEMAKTVQMLASTQAIIDEVSKNDAAIGYVGIGYVNDSVKVAELDGVAASIDTVLDGSYSLSRGLYLYSADGLTEAMQAFLDFVMSPAGQKVVEDEGFVPLSK